jgi:hypothetical protein
LENLVEYKGIKELNIHFYYNYDIIETLNNKVFKNLENLQLLDLKIDYPIKM